MSSSGLFVGIVFLTAFAAGFAVAWFIAKGISVKWYEWLLGGLGVIGIIATAQHSIATFLERAPHTFGPGLALFGIPTVLLFAVAGQLIWRRNRS